MSQTALMAVASRLHVFLRRKTNRITDIVWMTANADYAREVLRLVRAEGDPEMNTLAARFEELMPAAGSGPAPAEPVDMRDRIAEGKPPRDYIKTLR